MVSDVGYHTNERKLATTIQEIVKSRLSAEEYLTAILRERWTRAYDRGYKHGFMTMNHSESYNVVIKGARSLPIGFLLKKLFYSCVGYFQQR